ncbi:uncharacterized protein LOC118752381 [Rhagoletis pomonella]|uniref:uncharacterized protein LOC118752381 n=1 Tax=Rhagoletis pomonella TaxID=28610 RepID=UPI001783C23C|nr:uncharacterized protein LOC118752381 [Rhagoletis pomonella]
MVDREDADMQRIVWKDSENNMCIYRLLTVTYGLNCSPYLTIKVLHTLAEDEGGDCPRAAATLKECFYVDDCLSGTDTVGEAVQLQQQVQELLLRGGFTLRKWNSNSSDFLQGISGKNCGHDDLCDLSLDRNTKALGIYWSCNEDVIGYTAKENPVSSKITKRQQLSDIARVYDPTCLLAPVIITGKRVCQDLWRRGCAWDDPLPEPLQSEWQRFRRELPLINKIKIPRWTFSTADSSEQLHIFCDASTAAYAAVSYLRVVQPSGDIKVSILMAKTKVAPLKMRTIPQLELNGALLAATLSARILDDIQRKVTQTFYWCDSKTVLSWIRSDPGQHKQYIANRLIRIQQLTGAKAWSYVPTSSNPADVASRGIYPAELEKLSIWWMEPSWLQQDKCFWPAGISVEQTISTDEHDVQASSLLAVSQQTHDSWILHNYSSLHRLLNVTAWCQRFVKSVMKREHETTLYCTASERKIAMQFWGKQCNSKSKLLKLNPMLDEDGILRLNGRLKNAVLPACERFPIILPKEVTLVN